MSYDMSFHGSFIYPDTETCARALNAFRRHDAIDESVVTPDDLEVADATISVALDCTAPASMWEDTCEAIAALSEYASEGYIDAAYNSGDGEENVYRVRLLPGGGERELGT